jgi:hypothetical protein
MAHWQWVRYRLDGLVHECFQDSGTLGGINCGAI